MDLGMRHVTQLTVGTWQAEVLYTLAELDVFTALADQPATAAELAAAHGWHPEATEAVLDAGVALRLLSRTGAVYANTELSRRLLTGDTDECLVEWVRTMGRWARAWARLTDVVRNGGPALGHDIRLTEDPAYLADLEVGFFRYATRLAEELAVCIPGPLEGALVDLGGGCGAYSMALCRRHPGLTSVIWELPDAVPLASKVIAEHGMADRVSVVGRDYTREEYGTGLAAVLMSNMLHSERRETAADMLRRAHRALAPGGRLIVNGNLLNEDRTGPLFSALHNVSSMVLWEGGRDFSVAELSRLIIDNGFGEPQVEPIAGASSHVLIARKPE
ncbi:methyltransferase [Micromonospora sediminimaris]|uniref:SAM-dependent methyltransferase n=1 Tax=Micromonospora sediminimaris TaxID=547162 RepID=A0A9W5UW82_9ACTN|nr:methyltransferase [Micromonospora sediminimaris]GIJ35904.1 SAM-dependent methyltransferase [Micromonospora sediminimaris]SFD42788.1 Dimerisation domain-containing protein [Micromonospora sediminimaris]